MAAEQRRAAVAVRQEDLKTSNIRRERVGTFPLLPCFVDNQLIVQLVLLAYIRSNMTQEFKRDNWRHAQWRDDWRQAQFNENSRNEAIWKGVETTEETDTAGGYRV